MHTASGSTTLGESTSETAKTRLTHSQEGSHDASATFTILLNDVGREQVIADIKGWIDARLPRA
jgi:hypothetical protein